MYIGRCVVVGRITQGQLYTGYRVSARSHTRRRMQGQGRWYKSCRRKGSRIRIRTCRTIACGAWETGIVVGNGTQTDPILEQVQKGYPLRDAIGLTLLALDYEHDEQKTPRIVAAIDTRDDCAYFGIVTDTKLEVQRCAIAPGKAVLLATYGLCHLTPVLVPGETVAALAQACYELAYTHPVTACAGWIVEGRLEVAVYPAPSAR